MSKTGSRYLAVVLLRPAGEETTVSLPVLDQRKREITEKLHPKFPHLMLELVPKSP